MKIREYKVNALEVETALLADAGVKEAAVLSREDGSGDRRLVAYIVPVTKVSSTVGDDPSRTTK